MHCRICPRRCGVERDKGEYGFCKSPWEITAARAALHHWEEPVLSGTNGSGTVFFSGCNLGCVFCQNRTIATGQTARVISPQKLSELFFMLQEQGAHNINLVTGSHYVPQIVPALKRAKDQGLAIPVVYNTGSYEKVETLKLLEGLVDIYLPDFKYASRDLAMQCASAPDYFDVAAAAIREMVRQVGSPVFKSLAGPEGPEEKEELLLMERGVMVRHLVLPGHTADSRKIIRYLYETFGDRIFISIMNQYTPCNDLPDFPWLQRRVTRREYNEVVDYAIDLGVEQGFIQEGETARESFIPAFDYEGLEEKDCREK